MGLKISANSSNISYLGNQVVSGSETKTVTKSYSDNNYKISVITISMEGDRTSYGWSSSISLRNRLGGEVTPPSGSPTILSTLENDDGVQYNIYEKDGVKWGKPNQSSQQCRYIAAENKTKFYFCYQGTTTTPNNEYQINSVVFQATSNSEIADRSETIEFDGTVVFKGNLVIEEL